MAINIGINGVGRIGRILARQALQNDEFNLVYLNDIMSPKEVIYALKFCSTQKGIDARLENGYGTYKDKRFKIYNTNDINALDKKVDVLIDASSARFRYEKIKSYARHIVLTHTNANVPIKMRSLDEDLDEQIVSFGSCTSLPASIIINILDKKFPLRSVVSNSIHACNSDELLCDDLSSHTRGCRSGTLNIIPWPTNMASNLSKILGGNNYGGVALRIPIVKASLIILSIKFGSRLTKKDLLAHLRKECALLADVLNIDDDELVSNDYVGVGFAGIIDAPMTMVLDNLANILIWHDNEYGYAHYVLNFLQRIYNERYCKD